MTNVERIDRAAPLLKEAGDSPQAREFVRALLVDLIAVDTTMRPDLRAMAQAEAACFDLIEYAIRQVWGLTAVAERVPISPDIERVPDYTFPYFTADAAHPNGLPAAQVYAGRSNLLITIPALKPDPKARRLHLNAHVDTVKPWIPARVEGDIVHGRGACDDKGQCVALALATRLLKEIADRLGLRPAREVACQFVVEEETGGNGSLSLALDKTRPFDCIIVSEATELRIHPANRGAVWYKLTLDRRGDPKASLLELAADVILAIEDEGKRIYNESEHPLFPSRPVQTCHGIMGPWGSHPSGVNACVGLCLTIEGGRGAPELARAVGPILDAAVRKYVACYGDKTKEPDPDDPTGKRMKVLRHFDVAARDGVVWLGIYGKSGHMGSTPLLDGAITKACYVVREIVENRTRLCDTAGIGGFRLTLGAAPAQAEQAPPGPERPEARPCGPSPDYDEQLVLEGGQGFVPTHSIQQVKSRLTAAVASALARYAAENGVHADAGMAVITFDKLHNNAYARSPDSEAMRAALAAARATGLYNGERIEGFKVSCDARLFADHRSDADVLTFGAGSLSHAHSEKEHIRISDIIKAAQTLALMAITY